MKKYDVVAISPVCVDIQVFGDETLLDAHGLHRGLTNAIDAGTLAAIAAAAAQPPVKTAGAPGTNIATGIALRGGKAALVGKIASDAHGAFFAARVQGKGVDYTPLLSTHENACTACVLVVTTPDKERSFAFIPGAAYELTPADIDENLLAAAKIVYIDSYLWLSQSGAETARHAASAAKRAGATVAMAINDARLIGRNRDDILDLVEKHVDIVLGDRRELMTLMNTDNIEDAVTAVHARGLTAAITAGAQGAYVAAGGTLTHVPALRVDDVVDTSGAGDQFAAGTLYGIAQGMTPVESAGLGTLWASEVIRHTGAEPRAPTPISAPAGKAPAPKNRP